MHGIVYGSQRAASTWQIEAQELLDYGVPRALSTSQSAITVVSQNHARGGEMSSLPPPPPPRFTDENAGSERASRLSKLSQGLTPACVSPKPG